MKKIILIIPLLLITSSVFATDYTSDANCMGAWPMKDSGNEPDVSGEGGTLVETSGAIPRSSSKPSGYTADLPTYSRDIEINDYEWFQHNDGLSTDISGANQAISMCIWVNRESDVGNDTYHETFMAKNGSDPELGYRLGLYQDEVQFQLSNDGSAQTSALGTTTIAEDGSTWYHLCAVYNDTDMRIYIDGSLDSNGSDNPKTYSSGINDSSAVFSMGLSYYMDGLLTEGIIFNRELSSVEVSDNTTSGIYGIQTDGVCDSNNSSSCSTCSDCDTAGLWWDGDSCEISCTQSAWEDTEDFESDEGNWSEGDGDGDFGWTRDSAGTPSSGTGPCNGGAGSSCGYDSSDYYEFIEASSPNFPSKVAYIEYDQALSGAKRIDFYYHMLSGESTMGCLEVEEYVSGAWTSTNYEYCLPGGGDDTWHNASMSTSASATDVRFKCTTSAAASNGWSGDMALDYIRVGTCTANSCGAATSWFFTSGG